MHLETHFFLDFDSAPIDSFSFFFSGESESKFIKVKLGTVKQRKGPWREDQGISLGELPLPTAPLGADLIGTLRA